MQTLLKPAAAIHQSHCHHSLSQASKGCILMSLAHTTTRCQKGRAGDTVEERHPWRGVAKGTGKKRSVVLLLQIFRSS